MYRHHTPSCGSHQIIFTNCAFHSCVKFPRPFWQCACIYCWGYAVSVVNDWEWHTGGHDSDSRIRSTWRKILCQCHFVHNKSHMDWPGIDSGLPRCEGNQSSWRCHPFHQITACGNGGCVTLAWSTINWQKQNRTETKVELLFTHTADKTQTFSSCFQRCVVPTFCGQLQWIDTSRGASRKMKKVRSHAWLPLALCSFLALNKIYTVYVYWVNEKY